MFVTLTTCVLQEFLFDSLLRLPDELSDMAVDIHRVIAKFVHEHTLTEAYQLRMVNYIIQRVDNRPELRDEALLQTIRMTYNNPNPVYEYRAWQLLNILLCVFTPTKFMFTTLLNYIVTEGSSRRSRGEVALRQGR